MYNIESMRYEPKTGRVHIVLIKETDATEFGVVTRYRNNVRVASLSSNNFSYTRRGKFLVGTTSGDPKRYPEHWVGVGEWRFDDWIEKGIHGNVRGCI